MADEIIDLGCEYELKSESDKVATFTGIASTNDKDSDNDIIAEGAFNPLPRLKDIKMLRDHNRSEVIGGYTVFRQQGTQLYVEGEMLVSDIAKARETYALMKKGYVSGLSVGFRIKSLSDVHFDERTGIRTIKKASLKECSIVAFPANRHAQVTSVKSELNLWLKERGFDPDDLETALQFFGAWKRKVEEGRKKDDDDNKRRDFIKGIDGYVPIDATQAEEVLRGLLTQQKARGQRHV